MPAKFKAILCDDVRVEDNGKYLAIGIYTNGLVIPNSHAQGVFALLLMLSNVEKGEHTIRLVIETANGRKPDTFYEFEVFSDLNCATLHFHNIPLDEKDPKFFKIWASVDDEPETEIENTPILVSATE